ncbi:unnamed protein product (macronuclear) [Paramecium tetraurelia]|uniref:Uncharacterized protein n=1 Tax=Paramecium tetraurelia TaxID=5888 RepID=A0BRI5_PARTE|nr:uncharacterized protein GSPATT00031383001 [Paramecium tetraurelia]CAK61152.1 unnamed protein product [Paramecium tetraurelia]|eukprot:XP_001428550.1 hypothetical protein (macronuclear) [Paramecium tetraurelia strain d4-2]
MYNSNCISTADGTCQERLKTCDLYFTQNCCSTSATKTILDKRVNGTIYIPITIVAIKNSDIGLELELQIQFVKIQRRLYSTKRWYCKQNDILVRPLFQKLLL